MKLRHFLQFKDLSRAEHEHVFARTKWIKAKFKSYKRYWPLEDRTLAMIFEKPSTRTRMSFEAGMHQLGGAAIYLYTRDSQLGRGEPVEDVAQVAREFGREANADMGFKAIWWLAALMGETNRYDGAVRDYQPVWGTGCAIVELTPAPKKQIEFEKEFDEGPALAVAEQGTGLETHNVVDPSVTPSVSEGSGGAGGARYVTSGAAPPPSSLADARDDMATILTPNAPPPVGPYPHARRVNNLLFLSGIGPRRPGTGEIPGLIRDGAGSVIAHDIEVQTRAAIENVKAILEDAGSSLKKVLDVTVYLTDMEGDFEAFNRVYAEYFGQVQPTRTTVGVEKLPTPIAVELKVIASC